MWEKLRQFKMVVKLRRFFKGLCTSCGRAKGVWRCGTPTCYNCDLAWKSEEEKENMFKHMGWDKRYPILDKE